MENKPFAYDPDDDDKFITEAEAKTHYNKYLLFRRNEFPRRLTFEEWAAIELDTEVS